MKKKTVIEKVKPRDVLELGTGVGIETKYCLQNGCNVYGVDIQEESLSEILKRLTEEERNKFQYF